MQNKLTPKASGSALVRENLDAIDRRHRQGWTPIFSRDSVEALMALLLTIGVVALLLLVRLLMPPVPGLLKMAIERWGKAKTIMLCTVAFGGAVLLILVTRR